MKIEKTFRLKGLMKIAKRLKLSPSFVSRVVHGQATSARVMRYLKRIGVIDEERE